MTSLPSADPLLIRTDPRNTAIIDEVSIAFLEDDLAALDGTFPGERENAPLFARRYRGEQCAVQQRQPMPGSIRHATPNLRRTMHVQSPRP